MKMMNPCERFRRALRFEKVDRLPQIEWAPWWDLTIRHWKEEGLPQQFEEGRAGMVAVQAFFGLDPQYQVRLPMTQRLLPADAVW